MELLLKKHAKKIRFALVGGSNTALDFGILFTLVFFGMDKITANYISTSIALVASFFANKSFTFKSTEGNAKKQFGLFLLITLIGLWVLQPIIITGVAWLLSGSTFPASIVLVIGKLLATVVTLIWNYLLYNRYVFKKASV